MRVSYLRATSELRARQNARNGSVAKSQLADRRESAAIQSGTALEGKSHWRHWRGRCAATAGSYAAQGAFCSATQLSTASRPRGCVQATKPFCWHPVELSLSGGLRLWLLPPQMLLMPLFAVLAAVIDAHQDTKLDELVKLFQGDAPHASQLRCGFALRLRVVAPAAVNADQRSSCQEPDTGFRALTQTEIHPSVLQVHNTLVGT